MNYRQLLPYSLRLKYALVKRYSRDIISGTSKEIAANVYSGEMLPHHIEIKQVIRKSTHSENKISNLELACKKVNQTLIKSGEIFSFWNVVGNPSKKNGYKIGRNLRNGELNNDYGGGLCQLSGLIYFLALKSGLQIEERHSHSVDIYKESERFTPLGSDATVVYGYKDLRIKNNYPFDILFNMKVNPEALTGQLQSFEAINERTITFEKFSGENTMNVLTKWITNDGEEIIERSSYKVYANALD